MADRKIHFLKEKTTCSFNADGEACHEIKRREIKFSDKWSCRLATKSNPPANKVSSVNNYF